MGRALSRRRILAVFLVTALLAVLAWRLLAPRGPGGDDTGTGTTRGEATEPTGALLEPSANGPTLTPAPQGTPRAGRPTYTLTVRVLGVAAEDLGTIRLQVSWRGRLGEEGTKEVRADPSGTTVVALEGGPFGGKTHTLQVIADGPRHLPSYAAVALPEFEERQQGFHLALDVSPERGGILTGRVLDPAGKPVPGSIVVADVWGGFRNQEERGHGTTGLTDAEGRFRLLSRPAPGLVALTYAGEFGPRASEVVALRAGETVDVGTIRLLPPQTWLGKVAGNQDLPAKTSVRLVHLGARNHSEIPGVGWTREGPVRTWMALEVAADGRFEVGDVSTGWWKVQLEGPDWGCAAVHAVWRAANRISHTRDGPLLLDASRARLQVRTTLSGMHGETLGGVDVLLTAGEQVAFRTDKSGYGCLVVHPETRYRVVAHGPSLATLETEVVSAPNGKESWLLLPLEAGKGAPPADTEWTDRDRTRLAPALTVRTTGGTPLAGRVRVLDADGNVVPTTWVEEYPVVAWRTNGDLLGVGEARLVTELPPGEYRLRVEAPGCRPHERALRFPLPVVKDLDVRLEPE